MEPEEQGNKWLALGNLLSHNSILSWRLCRLKARPGDCRVGAWSGGCALVGAGPPMCASCFR